MRLSEQLRQPVVVENRPGASSNIAAEAVDSCIGGSIPLLLGGAVNAVNAALYDKLGFNFVKRPRAGCGRVRFPQRHDGHASFPAKSVPSPSHTQKRIQARSTMARPATGLHSISRVNFSRRRPVNFVHVPYRGASQALTDMLGGQVQALFEPLPASIPHIRSGPLGALAVTTLARSEALPDVPALAEFLPGYAASGWSGFCVPRNTPAPVIETLNAAINESLRDPKVRARFADLGATTLGGSPSEFGQLIARETEKWAQVIRAANIKVE